VSAETTVERTAWTRSIETPLRHFLRTETGGAAFLLAAAAAALIWVNVDASSYERLWTAHASLQVGSHGIDLTLREWVNSGLMTFFFFVVGLEARREFDLGELRDRDLLGGALISPRGVKEQVAHGLDAEAPQALRHRHADTRQRLDAERVESLRWRPAARPRPVELVHTCETRVHPGHCRHRDRG
jgi:hypothetical protein